MDRTGERAAGEGVREPDDDGPRFACDAMMRGLARWLRACGYDASWTYGIADDDLLAEAAGERRTILTADRRLLDRRDVKNGGPPSLYVPNDMPPLGQAGVVLRHFRLPRRPPRCMACGGRVDEVDKAGVRGEAPPRTYVRCDRFFRCRRCGRLLWRGTHWDRIEPTLRALDCGPPEGGLP